MKAIIRSYKLKFGCCFYTLREYQIRYSQKSNELMVGYNVHTYRV